MNVKMNNNEISLIVEEKKYDIIDKDGQMELKEIYRFVKDNYENKENIIKNIDFENEIDKEIKNGIEFFIKELMDKFKESDFDFLNSK